MKLTVEETLREYESALATQSWDAAEEFFHDNATVVFVEGTYFGKKQVGLAIHKTFSMIKDENFVISGLHWTMKRDNFASCTFQFEWSGTINRKRFTNLGRGTLVWIHEDGRWQIVNEHFGSMPK
ncbi:MAG: nuclear transport factor 2 family protein [Erysipelotrichia bacterium]|nr:nuclear transport factor 2 family protein [Erysipelotrichia bacterium]